MLVVTASLTAQSKDTKSRIDQQLKLAGPNSIELQKAIDEADANHKSAVRFLIENFTVDDLRTVAAADLLNDVRLAYKAKSLLPWGDSIPQHVFFNDVLPHYNVDEKREHWRAKMYEVCMPIVQDCQTPSEAAQKLNKELFKIVGVKYSTARAKANQCPSESMEQGLASCTGLSILLTDACRSVCIPSRLVGIPKWPNKQGNHTWVEIWDGHWHFTGAAEPSDEGLNRTWFENDVALADKTSRLSAVYAVSFKRTDTPFPMLWSSEKDNQVYAVNVTDRYADEEKIAAWKAKSDKIDTNIRVWNTGKKERVSIEVFVYGMGGDKTVVDGESRGNATDMNDMLSFRLAKESEYEIHIPHGREMFITTFRTGAVSGQVVEVELPSLEMPPVDEARMFFAESEEKRRDWRFNEQAQAAYAEDPGKYRAAIWNAYSESNLGQVRKADFDKKQVTFNEHVSPYTVKKVGKRPKEGWPLFIAMHGGGGTTQAVNDSQWEHMQIYYKDQTDLPGYKYLALRAPNNTWNGFYDDYVYPLIENLVKQFLVHGDVNPDKVFIMGYSHGGYGAFAIGPKIPFRFAAIHSSAAAPTDGETSAKTLRNTRFTFMVGEKDNAYGRQERCEKFAARIKELKRGRSDIFPVEFMYQEGFGHGGLPDRDMISKMYAYERNVVPKHLMWDMTDSVVNRFFWLAVDEPAKGKSIEARIDGNRVQVATTKLDTYRVFLDERLINPAEPVSIKYGDQPLVEVNYKPSLGTLCRSLEDTGDIKLSFDFSINYLKPTPSPGDRVD